MTFHYMLTLPHSLLSKGDNPIMSETSPYAANKGEIASPATDAVVDSLKEAPHSLQGHMVNHNKHPYGSPDKGGSTIETPATDRVTKG